MKWTIFMGAFLVLNIGAGSSASPTQIINNLLKNESYDRFEAPRHGEGGPVLVTFGIYIETISSPNPSSMDYELGCYIRSQWVDWRLRFNDSIEHIRLNDLEMFARFWQPDIYFPNVKNIKFQTGLIPNFIARIYPNGTIFSSKRYLLLVECAMGFAKYPLDTQVCSLQLLSWFSKDYELNYTFFDEPVEIYQNIGEREMVFTDFSVHYEGKRFKRGYYAGLRIDLYLVRKLGHRLIQTFLPTALVVCLSWGSFWYDMAAIQVRLSICIFTLLILSSQASGLRQNLQTVNYVTGMDVWIAFCMIMDCMVLMEFTAVNYLSREGGKCMRCPHIDPSLLHQSTMMENAGVIKR